MKMNEVMGCAVYTRVSDEQGLDRDFNSLDAQYDAAEEYIRSQAHAGWLLLPNRYDDGGFSGGNTDRPSRQQLLGYIRSCKMNVVVDDQGYRHTPSHAYLA